MSTTKKRESVILGATKVEAEKQMQDKGDDNNVSQKEEEEKEEEMSGNKGQGSLVSQAPVTQFAPPDGGYGWVVVGACFLNNFTMLGIMFSWGVFQQLYKTEIFPGQVSAVSWIGTSAFGCMYILGGFCSLFAARIGYRKMVLTGSIFVSGGLVAASFASEVIFFFFFFATFGG